MCLRGQIWLKSPIITANFATKVYQLSQTSSWPLQMFDWWPVSQIQKLAISNRHIVLYEKEMVLVAWPTTWCVIIGLTNYCSKIEVCLWQRNFRWDCSRFSYSQMRSSSHVDTGRYECSWNPWSCSIMMIAKFATNPYWASQKWNENLINRPKMVFKKFSYLPGLWI